MFKKVILQKISGRLVLNFTEKKHFFWDPSLKNFAAFQENESLEDVLNESLILKRALLQNTLIGSFFIS